MYEFQSQLPLIHIICILSLIHVPRMQISIIPSNSPGDLYALDLIKRNAKVIQDIQSI